MLIPHTATSSKLLSKGRGIEVIGVLLATAVGALGGTLAASIGRSPPTRLGITGGAFGLLFALALRRRVPTAGAGIVWGLGTGYVVWILIPAIAVVFHAPGYSNDAILGESRARFPELVGYITCIGPPVGIFMGMGHAPVAGTRNVPLGTGDRGGERGRSCCRPDLQSMDVRGGFLSAY